MDEAITFFLFARLSSCPHLWPFVPAHDHDDDDVDDDDECDADDDDDGLSGCLCHTVFCPLLPACLVKVQGWGSLSPHHSHHLIIDCSQLTKLSDESVILVIPMRLALMLLFMLLLMVFLKHLMMMMLVLMLIIILMLSPSIL